MRTVRLIDPDLGAIEFGDGTYIGPHGTNPSLGFVVRSLEISPPAVRPVTRNRALSDGGFDDTRFTGARAVTMAMTINDMFCAGIGRRSLMQSLRDGLTPFLDPARRPVLQYLEPGIADWRQLTVRGEGAPLLIERAKYPALIASFVSAEAEITSIDLNEQIITPSEDVEEGWTYDIPGGSIWYRDYDRTYPASGGIGDRLINVGGNRAAHWVASLFGDWVNARLKVNDVEITFALGLSPGTRIDVDTRERTILLNGDPTQSLYHLTNFSEWSWSDLLLQPSSPNRIRFTADVLGPTARTVFRWRRSWY